MKEKLKSFGVPLMIILLLLGALFIHQLLEVKKQPQPEWSRSVPLGFTSEERPQAFFNNGSLFLTDEGKVRQLAFDDQFNITQDSVQNTKITRGHPFWTDGSVFIQMKSGQLVATEDNKDVVISENAAGLSTASNKIYYWVDNELFTLNPADLSSKSLQVFSKNIMDVYQGNNGSAIVQEQLNNNTAVLHYMDENEKIVGEPFATVNISTNQHIDGLTYGVENNTLTVLYNEEMRAQGVLSYKIMKLESSLDEIGKGALKPESLKFLNTDSGEMLQGPRSAKLVMIDGKNSILFTSEGHKVSDHNAVSVYLAPLEDASRLQAEPLGTTKHYSYLPFQLTQKSIAWLDYDGDMYELFGASQDREVISASVELNQRNVKEAVNNSIMMIFSSVITILTSFYWVLPSLFLLILLYMLKPNIFEKEGINWVEYASILIFLVMPLTFMNKALNGYFYFAAPEYLTFTGSGYVGIIVITLLSALIWKIGRNPDWGTFGGVFYFMGVYILLYVTSFGPYIFNLF
ncbi:hypothetical protein [Bacillus sp. Marseille-Q1617]|uniref:hypothetical protein n=1 Tax=Bacillus sp. Marseille-Q1617 TaxID=2736887 RepID=UPI00158A468B|nr:hypothetical protein [Bacillus sp. Marseille-Q1617]